jgi:hypothetical protein
MICDLARSDRSHGMASPEPALVAQLQPEVPHAARIWNYWMGGNDHFQSDRDAGDAVAEVYQEIVLMAQQSRRFLIRVVRHLAAEAGIRQFLDIGTAGVPYILRSPEQLAGCFDGLTMVEPGLVLIPLWRPDESDAEAIDAYGAVAGKP